VVHTKLKSLAIDTCAAENFALVKRFAGILNDIVAKNASRCREKVPWRDGEDVPWRIRLGLERCFGDLGGNLDE
jgi:hypothetical protein